MHGIVECEFENGAKCRGTGTLINENFIVTAAHCLHYRSYFKEHSPLSIIKFFSPLFGKDEPIEGDMVRIHPEYLKENDENYDFGVVKLAYKIGSRTGWATLAASAEEELLSKVINVTGYPTYKGIVQFLKYKMLNNASRQLYTMSGIATSVKKHKMYYRMDTSSGQSGAGVWSLDRNQEVECRGIHVTGSREEGNGAIRINPENLKTIRGWINEKIN